MNKRQKRAVAALRQVQTFLDDNATALQPILDGTTYVPARAMLDDVVTRLTDTAVLQDSSVLRARGETHKQRALRTTLREKHMRPIAQVSAAMLPHVRNLEAFKLPKRTLDAEGLATAAVAMADAAEPFVDVYVQQGHPTDVLDRLRAAAAALLGSVDYRTRNTNVRSGATKGVRAEILRGKRAVLLLDSVVTPAVMDIAHLKQEWRRTKRQGGIGTGVAGGLTPSDPTAGPGDILASGSDAEVQAA